MTKGLRSPNCERWKFIRGAPFLLRRDPETLEANLYSLAALLRIDRDEALKMVRTMPVLLAYSCRGLEQKFEALARALGERDGRVAAIQRPTLLGLSPDTIERRHARLRAVADKVPCWSSPESQEAIPRCLVRAERNYVRLEDVAAHFAPLGSVDHAMETLLSCPAWRWRMTKYFAALPEEVQSKYDGDDKAAFRHRLSATKPQVVKYVPKAQVRPSRLEPGRATVCLRCSRLGHDELQRLLQVQICAIGNIGRPVCVGVALE